MKAKILHIVLLVSLMIPVLPVHATEIQEELLPVVEEQMIEEAVGMEEDALKGSKIIEEGIVNDDDEIVKADLNNDGSDFGCMVLDDGTISIECYIGYDMEISIPTEIDGKTVTSIGGKAFHECKNLKKVTLPDSITTIGSAAFARCTKLESINLPKNLEYMGMNVFSNCDALTSIIIPKMPETAICSGPFTDCYNLKTILFEDGITQIPSGLFSGASGLEEIELPNTITSIGDNAFRNCKNLKKIKLPDSLTTIGGEVFIGCTKLENINLPKNLKYIGKNAFQKCDALTSITIPKMLDTELCYSPFTDCDNLKTILFEDGITQIPSGLFSGASGLEEIELPNTITSIGSEAFCNCQNLKKVKLPDSLTTIEWKAFIGCTKLESITLSENVISIGWDAFANCNANFVVYGTANSYAQTYCAENNIPFIVLGQEGFDLKHDGYCIENHRLGFNISSLYKIPLERYQEVYGDSFTSHIYKKEVDYWEGNCFGMATTAVLFYKEKLPVLSYINPDKNTLNAGGYDEMVTPLLSKKAFMRLNKNSELTKLIERYQIWYNSEEFGKSQVVKANEDKDIFATIVNTLKTTKEPYLVIAYWNELNRQVGHAMVIDSSRTPEDLGNGKFRIYLYDPNTPYFEDFGDKEPRACYKEAENRFLEVDVNNGQWKMDVAVNGSGKVTSIGSDKEGSIIYFLDVSKSDYPTDFGNKAHFSPSNNTTNVSYASDDFEVYDVNNTLIYKVSDGLTTYINDEIVRDYKPCGYIEDTDIGVNKGKLVLPKGKYRVSVDSGTIAYLEDGDYAGIVTEKSVTVSNLSSTSLGISSTTDASVNIVLMDATSDKKYSSIETVIEMNGGNTEIGLDDTNLKVATDKAQNIEINAITEKGEKDISHEISHTTTSIDVSKDKNKPTLDWRFTDVAIKPGNWKYEAVKFVYDNKIMNGVGDGTRFDPDAPLTREMFATVLYRMAGEPAVNYKGKFPDVLAGKWYSNAVIWASEQGIVSGYGDGRFGTGDYITREQIAKMFMEYGDKQGYDVSQSANFNSFADAGKVSKWANNYMKWAVGSGMISGKENAGKKYLDPKGNATRVECATMLKRFIEKYQ